ncbi:MAG: hypothetical protein M0036_26075 [Desulfobacteraceae bacterium]|nr:hypothetical protein [Desulfobacteraceae bacterium]
MEYKRFITKRMKNMKEEKLIFMPFMNFIVDKLAFALEQSDQITLVPINYGMFTGIVNSGDLQRAVRVQ